MQNLIAKANLAGLEGLKAHLERLKVKYKAGGLTEGAREAIKDSINELEKLLEGEE